MTQQEWIEKAKHNRDKLLSLLTAFHPCAASTRRQDYDLPVTAQGAEGACRNIRALIVAEGGTERNLPKEFDSAIASSDVDKLMTLLNEAWFGVPESTSCWSIPGFSQACDLLEDPPDEEYSRMMMVSAE